ncbi:DUF6463 family protein [Embleya sp. NPDC001921]
MTRLVAWVPRLTVGLAVVHFAYALAVDDYVWPQMVRDGLLATADDHDSVDYHQRESTLWFSVAGILLLALGTLGRHCLRTTGRLPVQIGWYLMASGVLLSVVEFPVTGGWLVAGIGILALAASRRSGPVPAARPGRSGRC